MTYTEMRGKAVEHVALIRNGGWRTYLTEFVFAFVGLFVLDISWRFMDWIIDDGIIAHLPWLKFLGDN